MKQGDENNRKISRMADRRACQVMPTPRKTPADELDSEKTFAAGYQASKSRDWPEDDQARFSDLLRRLLASSGLSIRQAAHRSWLDHSYLSRLVRQNWDPLNPPAHAPPDRVRQPTRDTLLRLALAMSLAVDEADELLLAAGYAPLVKN